jgi:hypothetical protein
MITFYCPKCKWQGEQLGLRTVRYSEDSFDNEPCCPKCTNIDLDIIGNPEPIGETKNNA